MTEPSRKRRARGLNLVTNWLWAVIVLALIGIVVWGWAFDFTPR